MRFPVVLPLVFLAPVALGCSSSSSSSNSSSKSSDAETTTYPDAGVLGDFDPTPFGGSRPVKLYVPSKYVPSVPTPLVILLHGFGASGEEEELYLDLHAIAEAKTVLYAHPDGTMDKSGNRFWNATDACCNFDGSTVDDVAYLTSLVKEFGTRYDVDPKRVYFVGHSNGGYMSYRMACDQAGVIAGIASLAGAMVEDTSKCKPSGPVSVLETHGTADVEVYYDGGLSALDGGVPSPNGGSVPYPGVTTTIGDWVTFDGCSTTPNTSQPDPGIAASMQTKVTDYKAGCHGGSEVTLWTIENGPHIPGLNSTTFGTKVFEFLLAHPKP